MIKNDSSFGNNYLTIPKERESSSTADGNEWKVPTIKPPNTQQVKLNKTIKISQFLNVASNYWCKVCDTNWKNDSVLFNIILPWYLSYYFINTSTIYNISMISLLAFLLRFVGIFFIIKNLKNKKKVKATAIFIKIISYLNLEEKK